MKKRPGNHKKKHQKKRLGAAFLFVVVAALFYALSFQVFNANDCAFFGSKLALIVVPACAAFGNHGAAAFPFLIASASLLMAFLSLRRTDGMRHRQRKH